MVLCRTLGDVEVEGYLPVGGARAHKLRDLHLPPGEEVVFGARGERDGVRRPAQLGDDAGGDLSAQDGLIPTRLLYGRDQLLGRGVLQEVAFRAGLQTPEDVLVVVEGGEHDGRHPRIPL